MSEGQDKLTSVGTEVRTVLGERFVFQQLLGADLKRLERGARNPRTDRTDSDRLLRAWYDAVVIGRADDAGNPIPASKVSFNELSAPGLNAFEAELTSFLGYA